MIVSIHQPSYWPWLGLIDKISRSDVYVILDHVAANKASNQYRNKLLCNGIPKYITLPVNYHLGIPIKELEFTNDQWRIKHLEIIKNYYGKAPFFQETLDLIKSIYAEGYGKKPIEVISETMKIALSILQINVQIIYSSEMYVEGTKGRLVYNICRQLGADKYLSGQGAKSYMDDSVINQFANAGIEIIWQEFKHPVYSQYGSDHFVQGLSCLDLFFNELPNAKDIIRNN
ncbi:MAG: WbqC family protein [Candidatus Cloacimonadaceae bacterium]